MSEEILMPRLGDMTENVMIVSWYVGVGDHVDAGDPVVRVETDKVEDDVPAPKAGTITEQRVSQGDELNVGDIIAVIEVD